MPNEYNYKVQERSLTQGFFDEILMGTNCRSLTQEVDTQLNHSGRSVLCFY